VREGSERVITRWGIFSRIEGGKRREKKNLRKGPTLRLKRGKASSLLPLERRGGGSEERNLRVSREKGGVAFLSRERDVRRVRGIRGKSVLDQGQEDSSSAERVKKIPDRKFTLLAKRRGIKGKEKGSGPSSRQQMGEEDGG